MTKPDVEQPEILEGDPKSGVLIVCDHASNAIPEEFASLGLDAAELGRHIAYDIGAAHVARRLARELRAPAVLSRFSRLLIDPNRGRDDPTLVMRIADGAVVPANAAVDEAAIEARLTRFYLPYDRAVTTAIETSLGAGIVPVIVSIHSFTPTVKGRARPWHCGVLWDGDERVARRLIAALSADAKLMVGANEPYDGALEGDMLDRQAGARGLANALVEIRQDLIAAPAEAQGWGERLATLLRPILDDPRVHAIEHHASRVRDRDRPTGPVDHDMAALEAAAFRRLLAHLRERTDVRNIDLMNLAGFCRNCLSNWLKDAADAAGRPLSREESRARIYGMPYDAWKRLYQAATDQQKKAVSASAARQH
jgi:predicted N-formylglutamate amidohydrolase